MMKGGDGLSPFSHDRPFSVRFRTKIRKKVNCNGFRNKHNHHHFTHTISENPRLFLALNVDRIGSQVLLFPRSWIDGRNGPRDAVVQIARNHDVSSCEEKHERRMKDQHGALPGYGIDCRMSTETKKAATISDMLEMKDSATESISF